MEIIDDMDQRELRDWLRRGLSKTDRRRTQTELARILGLDRSTISKILVGHRQIKATELRKIAEYLGEPAPFDSVSEVVPAAGNGVAKPVSPANIALYLGDIAAGVWRDMATQLAVLKEEIPVAPTEEFKNIKQGWLAIADESCNLFAKKGETVWVVPYDQARRFPQNHDFVVAQSTQTIPNRHGKRQLQEWTIRQVSNNGEQIVLNGLCSVPGVVRDVEYDPSDPDLVISHLVIFKGQFIRY